MKQSPAERRFQTAAEIVTEYLLDKGIGIFVPIMDATKPHNFLLMYPLNMEAAMLGFDIPDVRETLALLVGGDNIDTLETNDDGVQMRFLCIPVHTILGKRKAAQP